MKKARSAEATPAGAETVPPIKPWNPDQEVLDSESLSLSPQRLTEGVSTTTKLLDGILAQADTHQLRHWGINE